MGLISILLDTLSYSALRDRSAHSGHSADIFSYCDHERISIVQKLICHFQIGNGLFVALKTEVLRVVTAKSDSNTMVVIQHGGDTIETETVKAKLVNPKTAI